MSLVTTFLVLLLRRVTAATSYTSQLREKLVNKFGLEIISDFKRSALGKDFRSGVKFWVVSKILGSERNFGLGEIFWVQSKSLGEE